MKVTKEKKKRGRSNKKEQKKHPKIPPQLIYEEMDGIPIYYRGYKDVLNKNKTLDDIMGSSQLQSLIVSLLLKYLFKNLDENHYEAYTNEVGLHLSKGNNLASDIAIYKTSDLADYPIDDTYFNIPPKIAIEVDTKAELTEIKWEKYLKKKTKKLLAFGVEKVIWILTASQQVILAESEKDWLIRDWDKPFAIIDEHSVNLGEMLKAKGVKQ